MVVQSVLIALVLGTLRISTAVGEQPNIVQQSQKPNGSYGFSQNGALSTKFTKGPQFHSDLQWTPSMEKSSYSKRGHFSDIPARFLELDYVDFSMIVILPDQGEVPSKWLKKLENVDFPILLSTIKVQPTNIYLPKLKMNYLINPDMKYEDSHSVIKYWNSGSLYNHSNKSLHFNGSTDTFLEIDVLGVHNLGSFHNGPLWGEYHSGKREDFRVNRPFIVMILQNNEIVLQALIERPMENSYILQKKKFPSTETATPDGLTVSYTTEYNRDGTQKSSTHLPEDNTGLFNQLDMTYSPNSNPLLNSAISFRYHTKGFSFIPSVETYGYFRRGRIPSSDAEFIELSYQDFTMMVILPDDVSDLVSLNEQLENFEFSSLLKEQKFFPTHLYLPKFRFNDDFPKESNMNIIFWNTGCLYNRPNASIVPNTKEIIAINEWGIITPTPKSFHEGSMDRRNIDGEAVDFRVSRPFMVVILKDNEPIIQARIVDPEENKYILQIKDPKEIGIPTEVHPETSTTLRYNDVTPMYPSSTSSPVKSTGIAEDTSHVETTTWHPFSTNSPIPTGSPLKYVYTYDGKEGQYNESDPKPIRISTVNDPEISTTPTFNDGTPMDPSTPDSTAESALITENTTNVYTTIRRSFSMDPSTSTEFPVTDSYDGGKNLNNESGMTDSPNFNSLPGFDESRTRSISFHKLNRNSWWVPVVPTMDRKGYFRRGRIPSSDASFIELIYQDFTMIVILPDDVSNMVSLNEKLENFEFSSLLKKQKFSPTHLYLPKFRLNIECSSRKLENIDNWNTGYLYNRPNSSMIPESREIFIAINESGIITPTTKSFHKGPTPWREFDYGADEFLVDQPFMIVILKDNQPVIKARIVDPKENEYILKINDARPIGIPTVVYPETSTTLRYNDETPMYPSSTSSPVKSTGIAEDTSHVETTTWHSFSTNSSTPTGSPLKYVHTYDGKEGRYNESGFIGNKSLVIETISEGISNANGTDAGFANHMDMVKNVLDHAVKTSESKSESVKGSRLMEWIYRKFSKKNETEGAKTKSTSEGTESILTIFH